MKRADENAGEDLFERSNWSSFGVVVRNSRPSSAFRLTAFRRSRRFLPGRSESASTASGSDGDGQSDAVPTMNATNASVHRRVLLAEECSGEPSAVSLRLKTRIVSLQWFL